MIRILLAEDMDLVRGALVALLGLEDDLEVVAEVERGDKILSAALEARPDVAIIDIGLPVLDGLSAAALLAEELPGCRVLILTSLTRPGVLRRALDVKVSGFLPKDASPQELAEAVRRIMAGHRAIDPQLALAAWDSAETPLTDREMEVLRLTAEGDEVPEIASRLHLSTGTVRNYLTSVVTKLNARNRVDAVRIAHESGWLV
ncbi:LuxR C-terminal-related transcriptional regulator [Streptomyces sp. PTY087I2]|uniref:response regulator transcription factor n=1 Tax=Streptomyces sp. PTY087I2 TaxID=1819298 RepID=UPI000827EE1F|nr:response regulator transcription factor [Streptomyces sp. PTY087I2]OCC11760.1 Response regulator protein VraR [Streptomyces sp. PTY087I2]